VDDDLLRDLDCVPPHTLRIEAHRSVVAVVLWSERLCNWIETGSRRLTDCTGRRLRDIIVALCL